MAGSAATGFVCSACGEWKPSTHFHKRARSKTGYAPSCCACTNRARRSRPATPAGRRTNLKGLVRKGDLERLRSALDTSSSPPLNALLVTAVTPYVSARKKDTHSEIARLLIERDADVNSTGDHS